MYCEIIENTAENFSGKRKRTDKRRILQIIAGGTKEGKYRLYCILQTICGSGIRVSELKYITVKAVTRGRAVIFMKNKTRTILLPPKLCRLLKDYCKQEKITSGMIFITRRGNPVD